MSNLASIPTRTLSFYVSECERVHDLLDRLDVPRVDHQTMSQRLEQYVKVLEAAEAGLLVARCRG